MKPNDKIPTWGETTATLRFDSCLQFLYCHGFVTDGEKAKILARGQKWCDKSARFESPGDGGERFKEISRRMRQYKPSRPE